MVPGVEARAVLVAEALEDRAARGVPGVVPVSLVESAGARATKRPREDRTERTAPRRSRRDSGRGRGKRWDHVHRGSGRRGR